MENQELVQHQTSPEMDKFFTRLLDIKAYVKGKFDATKDPILQEIYNRLNEAIKDSNEEK